ncbi:hypothetical protein SteCoe_22371 [Stentor coeruleus]|uniref:Potassium channel domain-containing protein n=1 Tax=Stentor coeruleus TaxID=5963 RepID=A0A1R2BM74_9CILI|nr:hypothetical protein SteCoe_22371 [Stentor coeruleus]
MITCTMLTVLLSILSIFIAVVENRSHKVRVITVNSFTISLRLALMGTSLLQGVLLIVYWSLRSKVNKAYSIFFSKSGVFAGSDCKKLMIFEFILISIVQPYTFNIVILDNDYSFITLDDLITICVLCRSYFLFKLLYDASYYNSYRAQWVGNLTDVDNMMKFALKTILQTQVYRFIIGLLVLSVIFFALIITTIEKGINKQVRTYSDAIFLTFVTEITIGYGDIIPSSVITQVVSVFICFCGAFMFAMLMISIQNSMDLSDNESSAFNDIKFNIDSKALNKLAVKVVQNWWILRKMRKKNLPRFTQVIKYNKNLTKFKLTRMKTKASHNTNMKTTIYNMGWASRQRTKQLCKSFKELDDYEQISTTIIKRQLVISKKCTFIEMNCQEMLENLTGVRDDKKYVRLSSFNPRGSSLNNNLAFLKKQKDLAVKRLLMRYSQSTVHDTEDNLTPDRKN